jgi:ketopantoate reductase
VHVAVLGAGALGRVLGVRLAALAKVDVDFVVRESRLGSGAIAIERASGEALTLAVPSYASHVPAHADAVIVCVRADQVDAGLVAALQQGPAVPVVVMTPMLPRTYARASAALPGRVVAGMSSVTGYTNAAGVTRHWISRSAKTLIDEPRPADPVLGALVAALGISGIDAGFELGVHEQSAATVIALLPLFVAIDAAGSIDALVGDGPLLDAMFRAIREARALAEQCGRIAPWASALDRFLGPVTVRVGLALGRRRSPELISFVEEHFGSHARAQNVALAAETLALADEKGAPCESFRALAVRLAS